MNVAESDTSEQKAETPAIQHTRGPWIVDECTTPNGKSYFVNHLWTEDGEEETENGEVHTFPVQTHTDEDNSADIAGDLDTDDDARLLAGAKGIRDRMREAAKERGRM